MYAQNTLLWSDDLPPNEPDHNLYRPSVRLNADTIEVFGRKATEGKNVVYIVKYNTDGDTLYSQEFGKDSVVNNTIADYKFDAFNNLYILNSEYVTEYKSKVILQKYALDGTLLWVEQMESIGDTSYFPRVIELINDTCLFLSLSKEDVTEISDVLGPSSGHILAFNTDGHLLWERAFDSETQTGSPPAKMISRENVAYFFGNLSNYGRTLLTLDINNSLTVFTDIDLAYSASGLQWTTDAKLLVSRISLYRFAKLDIDGALIWQHDYGSNLPPNLFYDRISQIIQDDEGNIYITGNHHDSTIVNGIFRNSDILTIKFDPNGNILWENRYEYGSSNGDYASRMLLKDGSVYVVGSTVTLEFGQTYDYLALKIDAETGALVGTYVYNSSTNYHDELNDIAVLENNAVVITGIKEEWTPINSPPVEYVWNTQLLSDILLQSDHLEDENSITAFPNPIDRGNTLLVKGNGIESFRIVSSMGQLWQEKNVSSGASINIPITMEAAGVYILQLQTAQGQITRKILVR